MIIFVLFYKNLRKYVLSLLAKYNYNTGRQYEQYKQKYK